MSLDLVVPPSIEAVIQEFERAESPFTVRDVQQELNKARDTLEKLNDAENFGAWAEILAFALVGNRTNASPWRTFFAPLATFTDNDGKAIYRPDIADADDRVIAHWASRAKKITHPVLKARYADLAWEMCTVIAEVRRDPEMARLAIDAYLASVPSAVLPDLHDRFGAALRALDLACLIKDEKRIEPARMALMGLHREALNAKKGLWWLAYDRLIREQNAGVTEAERLELIEGLEELIGYFGNTSSPEHFNPDALQQAAKRLISHHRRLQHYDDVQRLWTEVARAFEHFAGQGNAMLASTALQTAVDAYRNAGLGEDSKRVRVLMQEKIGQSREEMVPIETEMTISREDMDEFLGTIVTDDPASTLLRIALEFLPKKKVLEEQVQKTLEIAPIMAMMPQTIMADDHVVAKVGSVEDDPFGRLLQQTKMDFGLSAVWLHNALSRTIEVHGLVPGHFIGWANRLGLFDDLGFISEGVTAWYEGDLVKAAHVLIPQIELGLRAIAGQLGKPVTKAHPSVPDASVPISMGDILFSDEITEALGPDLTLFFLALYADPRGVNLRNRLAHGLILPEGIDEQLVQLLIHTLMIFGVWKELAEHRR